MTNYDGALSRWLLLATAEMADKLEQAEDAEHWRKVQSELPELSTADEGYLLVARDAPLSESHRHFSHVISIHPLGMIAPDNEKGRSIIAASLAQIEELGTKEWTGYSFSWLGNIAARAGDGERAEKALKTFLHFTLPNSFHANGDQSGTGISNFTYRPFTLEGNCAFAAGIQEMLLQSWGGVLRIFPAIPEAWRNTKFHNLRGEGAFLVSAEMQDGELVRAEITAERGGFCRVQLPGEPNVHEADLQTGEVWNVLVELSRSRESHSREGGNPDSDDGFPPSRE